MYGTKAELATTTHHRRSRWQVAELVAITRADRNAMAALGPTPGQYGGTALGLHTDPEAVGLGPVTAVGLKCALRHKTALLW